MTATSYYYLHLDVRGALNNLQRSRAKKSAFTDNGRPMTRLEAIDGLMDELAKGHECMPMHKGCGKPCKNSPMCVGFDFGKNGGCPGYPAAEEGTTP